MINIKKSKFVICIVVAVLVGGTSFFAISKIQQMAGIGYISIPNSEYNELKEIHDGYEKLDQLINEIRTSYYKEIDEELMFEEIYRALFESLGDEYSMYLDEEEMTLISESNEGKYSGIGVVMMLSEEGECQITNVMEGSPAEKAGVQVGDIVELVEGESFDSLEGYSATLRGEEGTDVTALIRRNDEKIEITMERAVIDEVTVFGEITDDNIGVITINSFSMKTAIQFEEELEDMENAQVEGIVLDLRYNGGGIVDIAVQIADMLMNEGVVVFTEDKSKNRDYYETEDGKTYLPVVVLANGYSASSSEILIAGLKSEGIPFVGETTYGKGVIQIINTMSDGDGFALTINQFFTPDGDVIHNKGINPDYEVVLDENSKSDVQLEKAIEILKEQ